MKLFKIGVLIVLGFTMIGCNSDLRTAIYESSFPHYDQNPFNDAKVFYEKPHQLTKMFTKEEEVTIKESGSSHFSGKGFFLFVGGVGSISGDSKEGTEIKNMVTYVRFAWEIGDDTYITTTLPLEKVRIKLKEKIETPTISFFLDEFAVNKEFEETVRHFNISEGRKEIENGLSKILFDPQTFTKYLSHATFTVKKGDWPTNINLPLNQGFGQ